MNTAAPQPELQPPARIRWSAVAMWCALTVLVGVGLYASTDSAAMRMTVLAMGLTVWLMTAGVAVASGERDNWTAALASGVMVDTSGILIWVLGAMSASGVGFSDAMGAWCAWAGMWCVALAVVRGKSSRGRCVRGIVLCGVWLVLATSIIWVGGWIESAGAWKVDLVTTAMAANPVNAVLMALVESTGFVWQNSEAMYTWSALGDTVNPRWVSPYLIAGCYCALAAVVYGARRIFSRRG